MLGRMADGAFPRVDLSPHWQSVQESLLHLIDVIPNDKLNFTPREGLWNSRGILIHVADTRDRWLAERVQDGEPYPNIWLTARTKDDLGGEMARTFERLQRFLRDQAQLDATYRFVWDDGSVEHLEERTGHWIAFHLLEHDIHHRAELMQRLALLGIDHGLDF
jgi:uncharacterized damage-inducible protein DinB